MTARLPGTSGVISGVRLASHKVKVAIRGGFARTEIEEEFANDTDRVLEGRYVFPLPPDASISRLALWVGKELVEGEVVAREKAATIFKNIVDDTVRPRDPALLEWVSGSAFSLKIFPLPPRGSRKVVLAYDQVVAAPEGRARYVYPLSLGTDRTTPIDDFELRVSASDAEGTIAEAATPGYAAAITPEGSALRVAFQARAFAPASDFVLTYEQAEAKAPAAVVPAALTTPVPGAAEDHFVAVRLPVTWPAGVAPPPRSRRDRAVVVDVSHSQSKETLATEMAVAEGLIGSLDPDERFVLLACDSACAAHPDDGLAPASEASIEQARTWLRRRAAGGSSDVAGAIAAAARRLDPGGAGQIVYIGDGSPTAGELSAATIAARALPELRARQIDLRLIGAGRTLDEVVLAGLSRALGATYERLDDGEALPRRIADLALGLRAPVLRNARLEAPPGLRDVYPRSLPNLRVGQEVVLIGKAVPGEVGEVKLHGDLGRASFTRAKAIPPAETTSPVAARIWAGARIAELEGSADPAAVAEVMALSKRHHVMSRRTALLVLENDRMFAEFGIERTQGKAADPAPATGGGGRQTADLARALGEAASFGMLGALNGSSSAPRAAFGKADDSVGVPPVVAGPAAVSGAGGLGLGAIGAGGGGKGGEIGAGQGFGSGHGRLGGSHAAKPPQVRMGATSVSGRIPPETIQHLVRRQFGRMRGCYEAGLRRNASLSGRVTVRFVIGHEGTVTNVANGGSDLPDPEVISCVVRAFYGLVFPAPEGGIVTVSYPILFSSARDTPPPPAPSAAPEPVAPVLLPPPPPTPARFTPPEPIRAFSGPTAVHQAGDDAWMKQGEDALEKLRKAAEEANGSRQRHEALVRGLLARGRFSEALAGARRFADLDPDLPRARELLAGAAAAAGEAELSRTALDAEVELVPENGDLRTRAARAFEAAGDEARACAHWRALAEQRPRADEARYQAIRCRARLGDRDAAISEAAAVEKPGKMVEKLLASLRTGASPGYETTGVSPGEFEARVVCPEDTKGCPDLLVVKPSGEVVSPWAPALARSGARSVAFSGLSAGAYRTLLVGGAPDARSEVEIRAAGSTRKFRVERGGLQTVALTTVTTPW
jgi:Ca-activated chloride channel family protein